MKKSQNFHWTALGAKTSVAILVTAALLMMALSAVQAYYARKEIRANLEHNTELDLVIKAQKIKYSLEAVEAALQNHVYDIQQSLPYPDSLFSVTRRIVEQNPDVDGCCIAMIPNYYPEKGRLFQPCSYRDGKTIDTYMYDVEKYDYTQLDYFNFAVNNDTAYWSEPYHDPDDTTVTLVTYNFPVHDPSGRVVALLGVDLDAAWLGDVLNAHDLFPSSYDLLLSGKGKLICGPDAADVKHQEVKDMVAMINDYTLERFSSHTGKSTILAFVDKEDGEKGHVFYNTPRLIAPWQIAIVNYDEEVFAPLIETRRRNIVLTLIGLLILAFIIQRSAQSIYNLQDANAERQRMDNELMIAKDIQMNMLPETYPPFPDRNDLDIYGSLVPAKMVGGDLYDFFIRDEKLYFCIGDVSGKSVPAALVMAVTHSLFLSISSHESNPARIIQSINESLCRGNESNMFVTFFIGVLDLPTGIMRYCNAGHNPPLIVKGDLVEPLPAKANLPMGVIDDKDYILQQETIDPETLILLYTDGLTEAKNLKHKQFGIDRTLKVVKECHEATATQLIETVTKKVHAFVGDAEPSDDLTLLAIRYTPKEETWTLTRSITLENDVAQVTELNRFVQSVTEDLQLDKSLSKRIKLAVEEVVVNTMEYAYIPDIKGQVKVEAMANDQRLRFILTDSGRPFDPTSVSRADTTLTVEDRPIGGLGILLVRNLMDTINYERIDGQNVLRIEKKI
jgi:sigma-B regulation protein RsbU (phosphoserine phosphatase)